ncbi:MAG: hypothetical protein ACODAA_05225, partial [Gemmatimonadota bacterium]
SVLAFDAAAPVIQRDLAAATGDERRRLQRLLAWLAEHNVRADNAELDDEYAQWLASATVPHRGEEIPVRKIPDLIRSTEDRPTRRAYATLRAETLAEVQPLQLDRLNRWRTATANLGFGDYRVALQRLTGLSLAAVEAEANRFLESTSELYRAHLTTHLARHFGLSAVDAESHDAAWLNRQSWYDGVADEAGVLETLGEDLRHIGLPLEAEGRIDLAVEAFPSPGMRPGCQAVRVPDEVLVLVTPTDTVPGLRTLMREIGRGLHWAYTSPLLPFEFRALGDSSVLDAHATLLGGLGRSGRWVRHAFGLDGDELEDFVSVAAFLELYALRRMAARLIFDVELSESDRPGEMGDRWAELMNEVTGFRHDPRAFLANLGQRFGVARRLRGRMLAAQLARQLEERFDEDWFRNPESGGFLRDWFARGLTHDADALSDRLSDGLSTDELVASLERRLGERA